MSASLLDKPIVLKLNANWERIGWTTPRKAFVDLCGGAYGGTPPALALSVAIDENGELVEAIPMKWEEWMKLPVRECDLGISTRSGAVRVPTVLIAPNYQKMPLIKPRLTKRAILERDGYRCQYTNEKLPPSQLNIDHVVPRNRGGKDTWGNLVASRKDLNSKKGNKLNEEIGYSLVRKPTEPKAVPKSYTINEARHPTQLPFITK
jgi:hypothetical protein